MRDRRSTDIWGRVSITMTYKEWWDEEVKRDQKVSYSLSGRFELCESSASLEEGLFMPGSGFGFPSIELLFFSR